MIAFLLPAALALLLVVAVLTLALRRARVQGIDRQRLNVALFRERSAELDAERTAGRIDAAQHAALLAELQLLLVDDVDAGAAETATVRTWSPRAVAIALALFVPLAAGGLYGVTGFGADVRGWLALQARGDQVAALPLPIDVDSLAGRHLELRDAARLRQTQLQRRPQDAEAWFNLGVTWIDADVPMLALECFRTAQRLAPERPEIKLALARVELALNNGKLTDEIRGLLDAVLVANPHEQTTLLVYGMAAFDSADYDTAIARWKQLLALIDPKSQGATLLQQSIARAETKKKQGPATGAGITVNVAWSPTLGTVPPDAVLFVFVRAAGGPPMPVVAKKLPPRLPVSVTLTDADQMIPGAPLAERGPLQVQARLSLAGTPMPASGDLQSAAQPVSFPQQTPIALTIDQRLP